MAGAGGDVEIGLVESDALDKLRRSEPAEDLMDEPAGLAVSGAVGIDNHELRAQLKGLVQGHRRAHPESPGLV